MGASLVYLTEPNKDIEYETGSNDYISFAVGQMQGWRLNMVSLTMIVSINTLFDYILIGRRAYCKSGVSE